LRNEYAITHLYAEEYATVRGLVRNCMPVSAQLYAKNQRTQYVTVRSSSVKEVLPVYKKQS